MASFSQAGRPMRAGTPLGGDVLLLERLNGSEGLSRPFDLTLDFLSQDSGIDPKALLKKPISVTIDLPEGKQRFFHGLVRRFAQGSRDMDKLVSYRAEVVPWFWFLSLSSHCRVFQNKSVPDIVKAVFGDLGMKDFKFTLSGDYQPREYCVQYRETDLDFVSRLLEDEGIFYFFEHTADKHTMVLADAKTAYGTGPVAKLSAASSEAGTFSDQYIVSLDVESQFFTGKVTLVDYNMETPSTTLAPETATTVGGLDNSSLGFFDYPGKFEKKADGDRLARIRMEEREAMNHAIRGQAKCAGLISGMKLEVADYYRRDVNKPYVLVSVDHVGVNAGYRTNEKTSFEYDAGFVAIPATVVYRAPRVTPKAIVRGVQTAVVVGPKGEEIYVDKYARVKVQFFWDQQGKKNEQSSCWVRVSSTWAGKQWGAIQIPRIGQEVIVDFLEGDPDRPIITGRVYNAEQMPPYELPANGTQSGLKTRSATKGDQANFNEIRFEDKKGSEQFFMHAEKNMDVEVEKDETLTVGQNRTMTVDKDETIHIKGLRTETVDKDETITLKGKRTTKIDKDEALTISQGARKVTLDQGNDSLAVKMGNLDTKVDMGNVTMKAGMGKIAYEAMQGLELKVGGSSIKIDQMGVTIKGMMIKIEGQVQTEVKGMMATISGDAMLTVKGGITMIN